MEGKEEKQDKKELNIKVDCIEKAKEFPITLTCKRARMESYKFWEYGEEKLYLCPEQ